MIKFVTKRNCVEVAQEIVDKHYESIILALNIPRIKVDVSDVHPLEGLHLLGQHVAQRESQDLYELFIGTGTYIPEGSHVSIYALSNLCKARLTKSGIRITVKLFMTRKAFEKRIVDTLAHELRHAYQAKHKMYSNFSKLFYKYENSPAEVDARAWAEAYLKEVFK